MVTLKYQFPSFLVDALWPGRHVDPAETVRTHPVLTMFSRGCSRLKRSVENALTWTCLARSEGFEPPTF